MVRQLFGAIVLSLFAIQASAQDSFGQPRQPPSQPTPRQQPQPTPWPQPSPQPPDTTTTPGGPATGERQDYGIAPTNQLYGGQMHSPTPASIPGGQIVTTQGLAQLLRGAAPSGALLLDVLGGPEVIQGAQSALPASQPGSFNDQTQQQLAQFLQQATRGNKQYPIVTYCLSTHCWMSYNAALRAINLGYTKVLWYRGGIEAWKQAGLPTQRVR